MGNRKETAPLLEARQGSFAYHGGPTIFSNVSFKIEAGDILTILGPNGAGKSTLLDCLSGLSPSPVDWVRIHGESIAKLSRRKLARHIGYVAQMQSLSFNYRAQDYLVMGTAARLGLLSRPSEEDFARVESVFSELNIEHLAEKTLDAMSGGERQQLQIARVLVQDPEIVLFDEPTNHLDFGNQIKVLRIIKQLARDKGMGVIMTTHMPDHAIMLDGRVGILDRNGHLTVGPTRDIISEEALRSIYDADLTLVYVDEVQRNVCLPKTP